MSATQVMPFPSLDHALDLCARHARHVGDGAAILRAALGQPWALDGQSCRLTAVGQQAEASTGQIVTLLRRMPTQLADRAAIVRLTHALDDVLDAVDAALTRMLLFRLDSRSPLAAALVGVLIQQSGALERALGLVREGGARSAIDAHLGLARGLAAEADGLLVESLAGLRGDALDLTGMVDWLKWSEIHRPLATAIRHGRDAADAIETLIPRRA